MSAATAKRLPVWRWREGRGCRTNRVQRKHATLYGLPKRAHPGNAPLRRSISSGHMQGRRLERLLPMWRRT